ncbi:MAG: hypothetical protein COB66_05130 [Coxiella sp. (in: Bacteria)]|nr:MAG: hypothetical protein COB66_05130 [Coxiella sp. (in: g-proteobacteria)]
MRTLGKLIAWFILIILILYAISALVLHYAIHPKTYKTALEKSVFKATGHQMVINGALTWSVFPRPMLKVSDVLIKNQKGTKHISPYFAKIGEADIQIKLLPLLSGHVEPALVILKNADLNLVYQSAKNNPHASVSTMKTSAGRPMLSLQNDSESHKTYLKHFNIPDVLIKNTNINLVNLKDNSITNFKDINLSVRPDGNHATLKGSLSISRAQQQITLQLNTEVLASPATNSLALQNVSLKGTVHKNGVTNTFSLQGNASVNFNTNIANIPNYTLTWNGLPMSGSFTDHWTTSDTGFISNFKSNKTIANGTISEKGQYQAPKEGPANLTYSLTVNHVDIQPILKAIHYDKLMSGTLNLSAKLNASKQNHSWINHLDGAGTFSMSNAKLMRINPDSLINQAHKYLHKNATNNNTTGTTLFTMAKGTFKLHNGVFYNNDLTMQSKRINATGSGNINLVNHTIRYTLYLQHSDKKGLNVPVIISGSLHNPSVHIDYKNLGKELIINIINKRSIKNIFDGKKINLKGIF